MKNYATHWSLGQKEIAKFHGSYKALLHKLFLTDIHLDNMSIDIWAYLGIFSLAHMGLFTTLAFKIIVSWVIDIVGNVILVNKILCD